MTSPSTRKAATDRAHRSHAARRGAASMALGVAMSACSGPDKALPPPIKPEIQAPAFRAVTVSDVDAGAPVALGDAQGLVVRLATAVVDGEEWSLVDLQPPGVLAASEKSFERVPRGVAVESEGDSVWHFKPIAAGSASLRFELKRPRSLEPATRVVTYVVTVRSVTPALPVAADRR